MIEKMCIYEVFIENLKLVKLTYIVICTIQATIDQVECNYRLYSVTSLQQRSSLHCKLREPISCRFFFSLVLLTELKKKLMSSSISQT